MNQKLKKYVDTGEGKQNLEPGMEIIEVPKNTVKPDIIAMALNQDLDIDRLNALIAMKKDEEDRRAKREYNKAMVKAQANMPIVPKDKFNSHTKSHYSSYEMILKHTQPVYTAEGFAISMYEGKQTVENNVLMFADIMHEGGHTETIWVNMPIDDKGAKGTVNKTGPHAKKSSISYARGSLICTAFNIPTGIDDDGNAAGGTVYVDEEQVASLDAMITKIGDSMDKQAFLDMLAVSSLEGILAENYEFAVKCLNKKYKKVSKP